MLSISTRKNLAFASHVVIIVEKFKPQLIELTNFKPKLLIRFIMIKPCKNKLTSI